MTFPIGNRTSKPDFPGYVAEKIRVQSDGPVAMTPRTPWWPAPTTEMITGYEDLGYEIDTLESALYEFLVGKDYVDSWFSEAHGRFCFFFPDDWREAVERAGFRCTPDTHGMQNPWLIENLFALAAVEFGLDPWSVLLVTGKPPVRRVGVAGNLATPTASRHFFQGVTNSLAGRPSTAALSSAALAPSICSRMMSACPACRANSSRSWTMR